MGRLRGGRKEHIWIDTRLTSNAAAGPFSTQPSGPRPVGCFSSAAADRPVSIQIWALYRQSGSDRLEKQPTDLRRHHHYMRDGALRPAVLLLVLLLIVLTGKALFDEITSWPARELRSASDQASAEARKIRDVFVELFQLQPKISVNETVVFDQTKTALELAVVSRDLEVTRDAAQTWLGSIKTIRIHATYRVKAGFDLSQKLEVK